MLWGDYIGLGDDTALVFPDPSSISDPSLVDTGVFGAPDTYPTQGTFGPTALPSTLVADANSPGYLNPAYVAPANTVAVPQLVTSAIQAAGSAAGQALAPGPSPRVNVPLTTASVGSFLTSGSSSSLAMLGLGVLAVLLLSGGKKRR